MAAEKASQSFSISGGQLSNVQIGGQAGRDLTVTQSQPMGEGSTDKRLTPADVAALLDQLKQLLQASDLSEGDKEKIVRGIETAKDEVQLMSRISSLWLRVCKEQPRY